MDIDMKNLPYIYLKSKKRINGVLCYESEIHDNAGTHRIYVPVTEVKKHPKKYLLV